jgi:hypothetical protein
MTQRGYDRDRDHINYIPVKWEELDNIPAAYVGGHYDTPNILVHIRFNSRIDASGKRVLFIEEIQSDWHEAAYKTRQARIEELVKDRKITKAEASKLVPEDYGYRPEFKPFTLQDAKVSSGAEFGIDGPTMYSI